MYADAVRQSNLTTRHSQLVNKLASFNGKLQHKCATILIKYTFCSLHEQRSSLDILREGKAFIAGIHARQKGRLS